MELMTTPLDALYCWEKRHPDRVYLRQPFDGRFREFSWGEVAEQVRKVAGFLERLNLPPGSRIALLSKNCAEWFITDLAIMMAGHICVPIYSSANNQTIRYVLEHSESRVIFVGKLDQWQVQSAGIPDGVMKVALPYPTMRVEHHWSQLMSGQSITAPASPDADNTMSIIYTSGSTGCPKGVEISYRAYMVAVQNMRDFFEVTAQDSMFSYLPLAHITERMFIEGISLVSGQIPVSFVESLATFADDLRSVQPTLFIAVPRLWTRFQMGVYEQLSPWLLALLLRIPLLNSVVKRKIRYALGLSRGRVVGSGSAALSPKLLHWYQRLGIEIVEAWGMTENIGYGTANYPFNPKKIGSIGHPAPGVEFKLSDDGEILMRSEALFKGYYQDQALTESAFCDGFLRTGDRGEIDDDGYVTITGRVKDIFKTSKGKYITPVPIENRFADNPDIEQICVVGSGLKQPVALLVLSESAQQKSREQVGLRLMQTLRRINLTLEPHQKLDRLIVVSEEWTTENGLLTPTLKFKRHLIEQRYQELWQQESSEPLIWQ